MAGAPDWSSLPNEIWSLVLEKLPLEDFVRCRSICSSWFSIICELKHCSSEPRVPWLMLPPKGLNFSSEPMGFLDLASGKMRELNLPELGRTEILGSSDGWLIVADNDTANLSLFNPFSRAQIQLPPILGKPFVYKVYVSTTFNSGGYTVVAHHSHGHSFVRAGDKAWTVIHLPEPRNCHWNGTFCKGLLYLFDGNSRVVSFDLSSPGGGSNPRTLSVQGLLPRRRHTLMEKLVVLPGSDVLFLVRVSPSKIVEAFRLDQHKVVKVRKYGGYSLFVTHGTCGPTYKIISPAHAKGRIKENSVYIADEENLSLDVFDMEAKCATRIDQWPYCWFNPVWVTPVLVDLI